MVNVETFPQVKIWQISNVHWCLL